MNPLRRRWLLQLAALAGAGAVRRQAAAAAASPGAPASAPASALASASATTTTTTPAPASAADPVRRGRPISFPRDHGAHPGVRTEWWYVTGWLADGSQVAPGPATQPQLGFQVTFFRSRTGLAQAVPGRFAPRQLLFAHAAVTDLPGRRHLHDQRIVRWNEAPDATTGRAALDTGDVHIGPWALRRDTRAWSTRVPARDFSLDLLMAASQPPLLQGDAGFSRKGPQEQQASHYVSEPQLQTTGSVTLQGRATTVAGTAWMDHEWSDEYLHPDAVGWDWIGMNLFDGSALTAFVLRRQDGSALWAGGSLRAAAGPGGATPAASGFAPEQVRWQPGRRWRSASSNASYPVEWQLVTPAGTFGVRALLDTQELDSRASTGSIYWEGLSELLDAGGRRIGLGYLEMTGYAQRLKMG
jgi:predicted secreted hydrolase